MTFCPTAKATFAAMAALSVLALDASAATQPKKPASTTSNAKTPAASPKKTVTTAKSGKAVPMPRPRPALVAALSPSRRAIASTAPIVPAGLVPMSLAPAETVPSVPIPRALVANAPIPTADPPELRGSGNAALAPAPAVPISVADIAAVRKAADFARSGKTKEATEAQKAVSSPLGRKLVEWLILRADDGDAGFERIAAFIAANPSWPNIGLLRKRAEGALWEEQRTPTVVRTFFGASRPMSAKGRLALARAFMITGERADAERLVRQTWREDALSRDVESAVIESFGGFITRADHKARMDNRLDANDGEGGMRAAMRLGGDELAIAKARVAVANKAAGAQALLEAVPSEARGDPGYILSRIQWLRQNDRIAEAAQLLLAAPRDPAVLGNVDEWWVQRRLVARKLLDLDDPKTAYRIARDAVVPVKENQRAEHHFTAGWIALRFLEDPATALAHFARIAHGVTNPITLARAGYWQGRALEALGRRDEARAQYENAARFATAYYGQIARARLGLGEIVLNPPPRPSPERRAALLGLEVVRAAEILYAIEAPDLVAPLVQDLAEKAQDIGALVVLAELAQHHNDARAMLLIGKTVLSRGFSFDQFAFPNVGVPKYAALTQGVDRSVVYAIVRQESAFQAKVASAANAQGLMQIMPGTGRALARKFGLRFDQRRLGSDPVYNAQLGSAELGNLLQDFRGSYILTFAAYNAGRARVKQWLAQYGDPRDPKVDPIDWVERIPFSETRNYVQRVMENMQVYRVRLGGGSQLTIEADLRRGGAAN
jgi:soluble lytic murein transglycosylase